MNNLSRRYDIDWLRVIAIGLLLIYHVAIGFQPWGIMIAFITNETSWEFLWVPMSMLNVWRIPLLFFVSGMGVYFAIQRRNWKQLIIERGRRILLPFIFGSIFIVPIHLILWQKYYNFDLSYIPNPGHLWFLGNIFIYVIILTPVFFYFKRHVTGVVVKAIKKLFSTPLGLLPVIGAFVAEAVLVNPKPFEMYAMTWHGFFLGFLAFFFGFCFMLTDGIFDKVIKQWRILFLLIAAALFVVRLSFFKQQVPVYLLAIESNVWIFAVLGFGYKHLNRLGKTLSYLSQAAYPVYIVHMMFLYFGSMIIFPLQLAVQLKFLLVLSFTVFGSLIFYELTIRRISVLRILFGLQEKKQQPQLKNTNA